MSMTYRIQKFSSIHLDRFIFRPEDLAAFKAVDNLIDNLVYTLNKDISFSLIKDEHVVFIISFDLLWSGVAKVWGVVNASFLNLTFPIFRYSSYIIYKMITYYNLHRLQCNIISTFYKSRRMMKFLGFKKEATLYNYGPDKETYIQYSRIING